jgi:peptidylprolyl isomerase
MTDEKKKAATENGTKKTVKASTVVKTEKVSKTVKVAAKAPAIKKVPRDEKPVNAKAASADRLVLETTKGAVVIKFRPDLAPNHVARIKELAGSGFYNGVPFHRVIDGFMAQTGDPTGTGMGGSGQKLKAEFNLEPHVRGVCSMARAQNPDSGDSQFFICFGDARFLDRQYTVWGQVIEGMENVDKIKRGEPVQNPDKIITARIG